MNKLALLLLAALLFAGGQPQVGGDPVLPALQTTIRDPRADAGRPLTYCALLGGQRLCAEPLANAWCRQHGFANFVNWSATGVSRPACKDDDKACAVVATITCARVPIA